jgi:hypothetical protein
MSGLSINPINSYSPSYSAQNAGNSAQTNFQNLGQALQSGNLSAARAAFSALQKNFQTQSSIWQSASTSNVVGGLNSLSQSLISSNLAAAQAAYADLQKALQMQANGHRSIGHLSSQHGR